jgi:uncharacterized protein
MDNMNINQETVIRRTLQSHIEGFLFKGKSIILYGARQVGKSTLIRMLLEKVQRPYLLLNGDDADTRQLFTDFNPTKIAPYLAGKEILVIDEAQRIPEAGLVLKIIHDNYRNLQLIATGSSALELSGNISEPMTGRKLEFHLFPLSFGEMAAHHNLLTEQRLLEQRMLYGYYPDIVKNIGLERRLIQSLADSYLFKDLLSFQDIRKPLILENIVRALALQIGQELSYNELAQLVGSDKQTVERYIDLLEKSYIIFRLEALSRNLRNEIKRSRKVYFYDTGIRNAILGNFQPLGSRTDTGQLWENFIISERMKFLKNRDIDYKCWFWRTTQQQEIDYIEEIDGKLSAYEFKWNPRKTVSPPKSFLKAYPDSQFQLIGPNEMSAFIL